MAAMDAVSPPDDRVPVSVLTGFLGSGKTTLLNHILTQTHGKKIAVIENEFGAVGIDDELLKANTKMQSEDEIIEMMNGCICCTHLDEEKPEGAENEAVEQVAFADRLIVNKVDLVTDDDLARVEQRLRGINAFAPIVRSERSRVSVDQVLGIGAFDLTKTLEMDPAFLDTDAEHEHDDSVSSVSITTPGDVHMLLVNDWISDVLQNKGADIYRMKGVLSIAGAPEKFRDDVVAIRGILASGADPAFANAVGQTPLHIAALWANLKACEALAAAPA
ncbi:ATP binding protein [Aureococcus anophagefferens]|nr:ATP binding protein [Aureococcus anophagefferens]